MSERVDCSVCLKPFTPTVVAPVPTCSRECGETMAAALMELSYQELAELAAAVVPMGKLCELAGVD